MARRTVLAIFVFLVAHSAHAKCLSPPGDITQNGGTDIVDVQCAINAVLWSATGSGDSPLCLSGFPEHADLNCDGGIAVDDVVIAITHALGAPLDLSLDAGMDGCVDACAPLGVIIATVYGTSGLPVDSAVVKWNGLAVQTSSSGVGVLEAAVAGSGVLVVAHPDYAPASTLIQVQAGAEVEVAVFLVPVTVHGPFAPGEPIIVKHALAQLEIPAGGVVLADGTPAVGPIEVRTAVLAPTTASAATFPGPLVGAQSPGAEPNPIEAHSLVEVSLWVSGEAAQLAPDTTATLRVPMPASSAVGKGVGTVIPAWWYDLEAGVWHGEGAGVLEADPGLGLVWVAELSHFTWWMAGDVQPASGCMVVTVTDGEAGDPIGGTFVKAVFASGKEKSRITGATGMACFEIYEGGPVMVSAFHPTLGSSGVQSVTVDEGALGGCAVDESTCSQVTLAVAPQACVQGSLSWPDGTPVSNHPLLGSMPHPNGSGKLTGHVHTGADGSFCMAALPDATFHAWAATKANGVLSVASATGIPSADPGGCAGSGCLDLGVLTLEPPPWGDEAAPPGCLCAVHGTADSTVTCPISIASTASSVHHAAMMSLTLTYDAMRASASAITSVVCFGFDEFCFEVPVVGNGSYPLSSGHSVTMSPNTLSYAPGKHTLLVTSLSNYGAKISQATTDGAGFVTSGDPVVMTLHMKLLNDVSKDDPVLVCTSNVSMIDTKGLHVGTYLQGGIITSTGPLVAPAGTHAGCPTVVGDLDKNGSINKADVSCALLSHLAALVDPGYVPNCNKWGNPAAADIDCSGDVDLADIYIVGTITLSKALPASLDEDGNGCIDRCEVQ